MTCEFATFPLHLRIVTGESGRCSDVVSIEPLVGFPIVAKGIAMSLPSLRSDERL